MIIIHFHPALSITYFSNGCRLVGLHQSQLGESSQTGRHLGSPRLTIPVIVSACQGEYDYLPSQTVNIPVIKRGL